MNEWTGQARAAMANPDEALRLDNCPPAFLSLDAKLATALKQRIPQSSDKSLAMKVDQLEQASFSQYNTVVIGKAHAPRGTWPLQLG